MIISHSVSGAYNTPTAFSTDEQEHSSLAKKILNYNQWGDQLYMFDWFALVGFYGTSPIVGYLNTNPLYAYYISFVNA